MRRISMVELGQLVLRRQSTSRFENGTKLEEYERDQTLTFFPDQSKHFPLTLSSKSSCFRSKVSGSELLKRKFWLRRPKSARADFAEPTSKNQKATSLWTLGRLRRGFALRITTRGLSPPPGPSRAATDRRALKRGDRARSLFLLPSFLREAPENLGYFADLGCLQRAGFSVSLWLIHNN